MKFLKDIIAITLILGGSTILMCDHDAQSPDLNKSENYKIQGETPEPAKVIPQEASTSNEKSGTHIDCRR